jgi:hypothetical protein
MQYNIHFNKIIRTQMEDGESVILNHVLVFCFFEEYVLKTSVQIPVDSSGEFR